MNDKSIIKNVTGSVVFQIITYVLNFLLRVILVRTMGATYAGISSTFLNILNVLSLAELGIGTAIAFSLYEPLAKKDDIKVAVLINFFRKVYFFIGCFVIAVGLLLIPFLHLIISEKYYVPFFYLIYILYILDSSFSYFSSYKFTVLSADQKEYIIGKYRIFFDIIRCILQIAIFLYIKNFVIYMVIQVVFRLLYNIALTKYVNRSYKYLNFYKNEKIDSSTKTVIFYKVKALIYHRVAGTVMYNIDNVLISSIVNVIYSGIYSNYSLVSSFITQICNMIFSTLTASVGHIYALSSKDKLIKAFYRISYLTFWINCFCAVCLYSLFNIFIELAFGKEYVLSEIYVAVIVIKFYLYQRRNVSTTFINAIGIFDKTKYMMCLTALFNLALSIILGIKFGMIGIISATIITTLLTLFWYEPYILFKYGLETDIKLWFINDFKNSALFILLLIITRYISQFFCSANIIGMILKLTCTILVFTIIFFILNLKNDNFKYYLEKVLSLVKKSDDLK